MKYMLFSGNDFYPLGGWQDFKGCFESIEKAKEWSEINEPDPMFSWAHIVCENKIILTATEAED